MQLFVEGEVAQVLKCTTSALRRWRREGRGPRFVRVGRLIRYSKSDLEDFIEENSVGKAKEKEQEEKETKEQQEEDERKLGEHNESL